MFTKRDNIIYKKKLLAIIVKKKNYHSSKNIIDFFTKNHLNIQFGILNHNKNYLIKPHIHIKKKIKKKVKTSEVLYIISGKIRVDFYFNKKKYLFSKILNSGDIIMLNDFGHGFKILKKTRLLEVKQGPYSEKNDKIQFSSLNEKKIKIRE